MKLANDNNVKRAAFAAYNVAVGCEMLEQFDLALKWIDYSLDKYAFREAQDLKQHLMGLKR